MKKLLVVEDDTSSKILLRRILQEAGYQVDSVYNGVEALDKLKQESYDAVLTDWMMPELDGIGLIKKIRSTLVNQPAIIVVTALSSHDAKIEALNSGADDFIAKPVQKSQLIEHVENCLKRQYKPAEKRVILSEPIHHRKAPFIAVGIAASTGGPPTLQEIFEILPNNENAAFFIVLHGPPWMLKTFAEKLDEKTKFKVHLAEHGMKIIPGEVYLAPGKMHMAVNNNYEIELNDDPPENFIKPSADPLFRSIAAVFGGSSIALVLTGMGSDGSSGAGFISVAKGIVIAQDPETAILPSMPQSVIKLGLTEKITPLAGIPRVLTASINELNDLRKKL